MRLFCATCALLAAVATCRADTSYFDPSPTRVDAVATGLGGSSGKGLGVGLGVGVGIFFPSDRLIQNAFSDGIVSFGASVGGAPGIESGKLGFGFGVVSATKGSNQFFLGQVMATYELGFAVPGAQVQPYVRIGVGAAYANFAFDAGTTHYSNQLVLPTAQLEAGVIVARNLEFTAAYDVFGSTNGFNFDGFKLDVTYTLFRF